MAEKYEAKESKHERAFSSTSCSADDSTITTTSENEQGNIKMGFLAKAINKTVEKCLTSVRTSSFASSYPDIYKKDPKFIQDIQKEYKERLRTAINNEIDLLVKEENLEELFMKLDDVCSTGDTRQGNAWRPSGKAEKDIMAHLIPLKLKQKHKLHAMLADMQAENRRLESHVCQRRKHLLATRERTIVKQSQIRQCIESLPTKEMGYYLTSMSTKWAHAGHSKDTTTCSEMGTDTTTCSEMGTDERRAPAQNVRTPRS